MRLSDLVRPRRVVTNLKSRKKPEVLEELANLLVDGASSISSDEICRFLGERERLRSTGVGSGVAIPHAKVPGLDQLVLAVGLSKDGVDFEANDGKPVHIFMALAAPVNATGDHLRALAKVARLCNDREFRARLVSCATDEEAYETLMAEDSGAQRPNTK